MKNYILYCLPLVLVDSQDIEAIEKFNYFKAVVNYIDGNTVYIVSLLNKNIDLDYIKEGTTLELYRLKYLLRYYSNNTKSWIKIDPIFKNIKLDYYKNIQQNLVLV